MTVKKLRVVDPNEPAPTPPTLTEAVESGDVLAIMKAQRRIIADGLMSAGDNTRPQYSGELSKLNALIAAEEDRRQVDAADGSVVSDAGDEAWDGTGY